MRLSCFFLSFCPLILAFVGISTILILCSFLNSILYFSWIQSSLRSYQDFFSYLHYLFLFFPICFGLFHVKAFQKWLHSPSLLKALLNALHQQSLLKDFIAGNHVEAVPVDLVSWTGEFLQRGFFLYCLGL